jgi:hypothetical protein
VSFGSKLHCAIWDEMAVLELKLPLMRIT